MSPDPASSAAPKIDDLVGIIPPRPKRLPKITLIVALASALSENEITRDEWSEAIHWIEVHDAD